MTTLVAIKGGKDGLRLHLNEAAGWSDVLGALRSQLGQGAQFFNGARVIIDIGNRSLTEEQLAELMGLMHEHHLEASALASTSRESRSAARAAGGFASCGAQHPLAVPPRRCGCASGDAQHHCARVA